jgi:threonine aldolase
LSKGLGAPVGSILAGPTDVIEEAKLHRKRLGGTMRQAGVIAAAGLVAMRTRVERLAEDHSKARSAGRCRRRPLAAGGTGSEDGRHQHRVFSHPDPDAFLEHLRGADVLAGTIGPGVVRLVTHSDVDDAAIDSACRAIAGAP